VKFANIARLAGAATVAALLIACGTGTTPEGSPTAQPQGQPTTITLPQTTLTESPAASKSATPVKTVATFGDGMWQVPEEVKPGTYKTTVPADSWNCYYEVNKGFTGELGSILTNGNQDGDKQVIMVVPKTAKGVEVSGCGTWVKIK
jgi:hypothetical protein